MPLRVQTRCSLCEPCPDARLRPISAGGHCNQVNEDDVALCDCKPEPSGLGCGPNCLNRRLLMECSARFCQCGAGCQNQR